MTIGFAAKQHKRNEKYQVWTHENHAELIYSDNFVMQKINYIHENPVRSGIVEKPQDYLYSSARAFADTNYSSGDALRYLEEKNIGGYIPSFGPYKPTREGFTYYPKRDYYMCSQGKMLPFKKISSRKDNFRKIYWSSRAECKGCLSSLCCRTIASCGS